MQTESIFVAGHRGLVGSAVVRNLQAYGYRRIITRSRSELDLRDRAAVFRFFEQEKPALVIVAAAKVGGIQANHQYPVDFLLYNLEIQNNLISASYEIGVRKLLFLGSSCIYPKFAEQPIREESLLTGKLEETNDAYAIAKIAGVLHTQALRREYALRYVSAMPTNLYGPGDNFHATNSHVLPALIRRFHEAVRDGAPSVTLWGTGTARREFLHVDDLPAAGLVLLEQYDDPAPINVGVGQDVTIP